MTDLRRKLIEHEIKKYEELEKMFMFKAHLFLREANLFNYSYRMMAMNMFAMGLDWKDKLRSQLCPE